MDFKEQNKVIARFLGWGEQTDPTEKFFGEWFDTNGIRRTYKNSEVLLFHSDWNWLMLAVSKVLNVYHITLKNDDLNFNIYDSLVDINKMYEFIVKFIKENNL